MARSYIYQIARRRTAFAKPFVWWVKDDLRSSSGCARRPRRFVGFHDFRAFSDDDPAQKSTEVQLEALDVHEDEDLLVRPRRGLALPLEDGAAAGRRAGRSGARTDDRRATPRRCFDADPRTVAPLTAPASGLFLERVYYKDDPRDAPLRGAVRIASA